MARSRQERCTSAPHLRLEKVRTVVGSVTILDDIDLEVAPGEHVAVVGRSGSGKSTLLDVVLGIIEPAEGRVLGAPSPGDESVAWSAGTTRLWNESLDACGVTQPSCAPTHDLHDTLDFDRVVVLDGGAVVEVGAPRELVTDPGSAHAQLLATDDPPPPGWHRIELPSPSTGAQSAEGPDEAPPPAQPKTTSDHRTVEQDRPWLASAGWAASSLLLTLVSVGMIDVAFRIIGRAALDNRAAGAAVGFGASHPGGAGLTDPVDLVVRSGLRVLISGPSGCGKTTLGQLLNAERAPTSGTVERRPGLRVVRVPRGQGSHLFQASLAFNLLAPVAWPPANEDLDRAEAILAELGLDDLLSRMPGGLSQPVGDGGWRLSSGERARLSLARALLQQPDVLILDETTAPLDGEARARVLDAAVGHSKATVLIAHP